MAEAVGPLEQEMVERVKPVPSWTSLPAAGSTDMQLESPEEINPQDGHLDLSLQKSPLEALARQLQIHFPLPPHLIGRPVGPNRPRPEAGRLEE